MYIMYFGIFQKTHQEMADEKQLHLVEFRTENLDFPKVVASPQDGKVRTASEIPFDEELDFNMVSANCPPLIMLDF